MNGKNEELEYGKKYDAWMGINRFPTEVVYVGKLIPRTKMGKMSHVVLYKELGGINICKFESYFFEDGELVMMRPKKIKLRMIEQEYADEIFNEN